MRRSPRHRSARPWAKARGLIPMDWGLCRLMMRRTNANLKHWAKKRGLIRSMPGVGQQLLGKLCARGKPELE